MTNGWLDISASSGPAGLEVRINRLIFDDASTTAPSGVAYTDSDYPKWEGTAVPEPSSFGMLALGAGGLLARRRRAKQAA